LILIAVPLSCAVIGFAVGRYTSPRETFYLIGTPVDLTVTRNTPLTDNVIHQPYGDGSTLSRPEPDGPSAITAHATCGARTKAGKPCRRKVKNGGVCWQHRDAATQQREQAR
jgi:hypothetical protein